MESAEVGIIEKIGLQLKVDSFVVEANIHFPTDLNLLWDCGRKCLDFIGALVKEGDLIGWRTYDSWHKKLKKAYRKCSEIHRKKGKNYWVRLELSVQKYLQISRILIEKIEEVLVLETDELTLVQVALQKALKEYKILMVKHVDLVERRILQKEVIPHEEKLFSIFEQHVEWLCKGKAHKKVELGRNVCIASDQYQFIVHHYVMKKQTDKGITIEIGSKIVENYATSVYEHQSISFDRNYYSALAKIALNKDYELVVLPKPGKKSPLIEQEENGETFQHHRRKHSTVEANIHHLECNGLDKCPDKGEANFKKYVAVAVLAYNLQRLGKWIKIFQEEKQPSKRVNKSNRKRNKSKLRNKK